MQSNFHSHPSIGSRQNSNINDFKKSLKVPDEEWSQVNEYKRNFYWFSIVSSLNHALVFVVYSYASSLLDATLASVCLAMIWIFNAISGFTIASLVVRVFGSKKAITMSLTGNTLIILATYIAMIDNVPIGFSWPFCILSSMIGGAATAVWWTAQGIYFEESCEKLEQLINGLQNISDPKLIDNIRNELSAIWAFIYQGSNIVVFLALSVLPQLAGIPIHAVFASLVFLGFLTLALTLTFKKYETISNKNVDISRVSLQDGVMDVSNQMRNDARVTLLSPFMFGFGISTAMMSLYVNKAVSDSDELGTDVLGYLEAYTYFICMISAIPYAMFSNRVIRGQDYVMQFGSISFLFTGVLVMAWSKDYIGHWGQIIAVKTLYGLGRGVFEGICRAVYARLFQGEDLSTAYSNQTISAGISGGISFLIFSSISGTAMGATTIVNGIVALTCYAHLMYNVPDDAKPLPWSKVCNPRSDELNPTKDNEKSSMKKYLAAQRETNNSNPLHESLMEQGRGNTKQAIVQIELTQEKS